MSEAEYPLNSSMRIHEMFNTESAAYSTQPDSDTGTIILGFDGIATQCENNKYNCN
jgi:hypothetical protein